jgi:DNA-binding response OmpR family regulator
MKREGHSRLLLLGLAEEAVAALSRTTALRDFFVVTASPKAAVEDLASRLKPAAILLDASELYLEGRQRCARLRERSGGSRILFLDVEQSWALWMEPETEQAHDVLIAPCDLSHAAEALVELLNGTAGSPPVRESRPMSLEPTG